MKLRNLLFIGLASAALFAGCKEDEVEGTPSITIDPTSLEVGVGGDTETITLTSTRDWSADFSANWITVEPASGSASNEPQTITIKVDPNAEGDPERTATVVFRASVASANLTIHQDGEEVSSISIAEFLEKTVSEDIYYQLTGEITDLWNEDFGSFTLVDATGSVEVYGLTATQQSSNDKSFSTLGLKEGDIVTLMGQRSEHGGEPQVGGPAYYVSHTAYEDIEAVSMSVEDVFTTSAMKVSVKGQVIAAGNVSFVINDGSEQNLYVYVNAAPEVSVGDVVEVTGKVSQYPDYVNSGVTIATKLTQITSPTVEKISETITPASESPKALSGAELAAFVSASSPLVTVDATVEISQSGDKTYTNLNFGEGGTGSVVSSSFDDEFTDGRVVSITGYYGGRNARGYFNILPTSVSESTAPRFSVSPITLSASSSAGTTKFNVDANVSWTATSSDDTNFKLSHSNGEGNQEITVTYTENTGSESRQATITVSTTDENISVKSYTVTITQAAPSTPTPGNVITLNIESIEAGIGALGSNNYGNYGSEKTGEIGGVTFAAKDICTNSKDGTYRVDARQVLQIKKSTGYITNTSASEIKSLKVYMVDKDTDTSDDDDDLGDITICVGSDVNPTTEAQYTYSKEQIVLAGDEYDGDVTKDLYVIDVTLSDAPEYFKITSSSAIWISKIEIEF